MNKLKQIEALVDKAIEKTFTALYSSTAPLDNEILKPILTDLAKRSAEIDVVDFDNTSPTWIYDKFKEYNTRLRGEVKCTCKNPLEYANCDKKCVRYYEEVGQEQPALQPLPEKMPDDFLGEFTMSSSFRQKIYDYVIQHFGTPPRAWWMDLKKGNKFMYGKNAYELDAILLRTVNDYTYNIDNCSPYTDPEAQLRKTLNPEQIKLLDEMKANTKV